MAHNIRSAYDEIELHNYDVALLDIGLGTAHSPEIADLLKETGTPFAFVTGYDHAFAKRTRTSRSFESLFRLVN